MNCMSIISVQDIQNDPLTFLRRVEAGVAFVVVQGQRPLAEVRPVAASATELRPFGLCAGCFTVPTDFDALSLRTSSRSSRVMRILLDTHIFLWYISADPQLPPPFRDPANEVYLSAASVWEVVIRDALGKLRAFFFSSFVAASPPSCFLVRTDKPWWTRVTIVL
jgi:antitoxin (DNA-binding transcriptional repressor) of toxin-antitoxin stability system